MSSQANRLGDQYVDFVVAQIDAAESKLATFIDAAEIAADQIVSREGGLLAAGDQGFAMEQIWRSAGFAFCRRYKPDLHIRTEGRVESADSGLEYFQTVEFERRFHVQNASSNDVVLLGYENETEEEAHLARYVQDLISKGALVVLFASQKTAEAIEKQFGRRNNLIPITHDVPDGGLIAVQGWPEKVCPGRGMVNRLNLWMFAAELIAAFLRRGKMPGILLSATYESPQIFNIPLIESYRFIPAFNVEPLEKGSLGRAYLSHLQKIAQSIAPDQREQFRHAAQWLAGAVENGRRVLALTMESVQPIDLPGNPKLFVNYTDPAQYDKAVRSLARDEVALYVGYNWYPTELAEAIDRSGGKLILSITTVHDFPPQPLDLGEPFIQVSSMDQLPRHENHIYINSKFDQYDGCMKIPGHPIHVLPTSFLSVPLVYWYLVADTVQLIASRKTVRG